MNTKLKTIRGWTVIGLLFAFMMINYADKSVLGLVAVPMMRDMNLSATQFGLLGSAFYLLYSISGIGFGLLTRRVKTRWLLVGLALTWAAVQFPLALPVSFGTVLACRVLLGFGEGPAYPLALHAAYTWFDDRRRSVPTSIIQSGAAVGIMVAAPALTWVTERYSWRGAFLALGIIGLAWVVLWVVLGAEGAGGHVEASDDSTLVVEHVPFARLLLDPTVLVVTFQLFLASFVMVLGVIWGPIYLRTSLGYTAKETGWIFAAQLAVQLPLGLSINALSQYLIARGISTRFARGIFGSACFVIGGLAYLILLTAAGPGVKLVWLTIGAMLAIQVNTLGPQLLAELTPEPQRGAVLSISMSTAAIAGVLAPVLQGRLMDAVGSQHAFNLAYCGIGVALLVLGALSVVLVHPERSKRRISMLARRSEFRAEPDPVV